ERRQHPRGLVSGGARPDPELAVGRRDAQLVEEDPRELVVVVLARVHDQLLVALAKRPRDRGRLDELWPVADHADDPHNRIPLETAPLYLSGRWLEGCSAEHSARSGPRRSSPVT